MTKTTGSFSREAPFRASKKYPSEVEDSPSEQKTIESRPYVLIARPSPVACCAWLATQDDTFWIPISGFAK
jgi:hypothetical protein